MKAERWRQAEKLFDAAAELPAAEREDFLKKACEGDESLLREVRGMFEAQEKIGDFMESPAMEVVAKQVAQENTLIEHPSFIGREVGQYKIEKLIGAGGMGEVYLAHDIKLDRKVALKVLPKKFVSDPERVKRFEREARAVSALNHPNLITIHDIGASDGEHFIATEFVEGKTLSGLIADGLSIKDSLVIAIQVAEGLSAAHDAGIIHRDIKAENIMVRPDGYVKVLDFGLAKLIEQTPEEKQDHSPQTEPGFVMGTLAFMSPEQATGEAVDYRTDIWSLGVALYEMVTGLSPFKGANRRETFNAILTREPLPATNSNPALPTELDRILCKALEKDRELRYQTFADFRADLKRLKRELDSSASSASHSGKIIEAKQTNEALPVKSTSWRKPVLISLTAIAFILSVWFLATILFKAKTPVGPDWSRATNLHLTNLQGPESYSSISPDGKSFVYVSVANGNRDIYWQRVGGEAAKNLTESSKQDDICPAFSPNGNYIAFYSEREPRGLYIMGATGENPHRIADVGYNPSWSPDGKELVVSDVLIEVHTSIRPAALWIINVATGAKRRLTRANGVQPSWSPDGNRIAYWFLSKEGRGDIATISTKDDEPVRLTAEATEEWNPVWSPDGRFIYFAGDRSGSMNFWRIAVDERNGQALGPPEAVTTPSRYVRDLSFSHDGKKFAYVRYESRSNLLGIPFDAALGKTTGEPVWITRVAKEVSFPQLSPDGEYYVMRGEGENIIIFNKDGSNWRVLTNNKFSNRRPRWFPDSKRIIFSSDESGVNQLWTINADSTGLQQLTFAAIG